MQDLPEAVVVSDEQAAKQQRRTAISCLARQRRPNVCETTKLCTSAHSMRTNIVIDDALMRQAMQASGARSKREAVELGLRTLVRLQQQGEIRSYRGQMQWEGDLEAQRLDVGLDPVTPADREQHRL